MNSSRGLLVTLLPRFFSSNNQTGPQQRMKELLTGRFPGGNVKVVDVSGGCGAMFEVFVETNEFVGLSTLKQHKLITQLLKDQIKNMHGVRIHTSIPSTK